MPSTAPAFPRRVIAACVPAEDVDAVLWDLECLYADRVARLGPFRAQVWYARQAIYFVTGVGLRRLGHFFLGRDGLRGEARYAIRSLARRPAFALSFVLTLAIGVGVLATVYAAARWVLLRPVPGVVAPNELVILQASMKEAPAHVNFGMSHPDFTVLRQRLDAGGLVAATTRIDVDLSSPGAGPRRVAGEMVSANYFTVLGARLVAGRSFVTGEDGPRGDPVVIVSEALARQLGADAEGIIGTDVVVNGTPSRVVGVAESAFRGSEIPGKAMIWMPLSSLAVIDPSSGPGAAANRGESVWKNIVVRPRTGVSTAALQRDADAIVASIRREFAGQPHSFFVNAMGIRLIPGIGLDPGVRATTRKTLTFLGGAAGLLLLLTIANLANLTLARAMTAGPAMAIRVALGASRGRLARTVLVDALVLGAAGTVAALIFAGFWARWYQGTQLDQRGASLAGMHVDPWALALALAASVIASVLAFARPALMTHAGSIDPELKRARASSGGQRFRTALVAAQVALTVVLLVGAGLMARTVAGLRRIDLGFSPDRLLTFSIDPHLHGVEAVRLTGFAREFERRAAETPAIRGAGLVSPVPMVSSYITASLRRPGTDPQSPDPTQRGFIGAGYYVSPGFLAALGARFIGEQDWAGRPGTVVITRGAAAKLYPGERAEAVVNRLAISRRDTVRVAGVIEDVQLSDITSDPAPAIFFPLEKRLPGLSVAGFVAADSRVSQLAPTVYDIVGEVSPDLPVYAMRTARDAIDLQFSERMALARAASTLGAIGLLLAALGLYGVLASLVAARRRELGIRAAMGAAPTRIIRGVLGDGFGPVSIGLLAGGGGAAAITKLIRNQLFAVDRFDPFAWTLAVAALMLVALAACAVPAWRASRISPAEVLRAE